MPAARRPLESNHRGKRNRRWRRAVVDAHPDAVSRSREKVGLSVLDDERLHIDSPDHQSGLTRDSTFWKASPLRRAVAPRGATCDGPWKPGGPAEQRKPCSVGIESAPVRCPNLGDQSPQALGLRARGPPGPGLAASDNRSPGVPWSLAWAAHYSTAQTRFLKRSRSCPGNRREGVFLRAVRLDHDLNAPRKLASCRQGVPVPSTAPRGSISSRKWRGRGEGRRRPFIARGGLALDPSPSRAIRRG